jgi:hypothetical protein
MLTLSLLAFLTGCHVAPYPYKDYLDRSVGHTKHDAITEKIGAPNRTVALETGGEVWTYEYCAGGVDAGTKAAAGTLPQTLNCRNIILVFDQSGKLVRWHDQDLTASP